MENPRTSKVCCRCKIDVPYANFATDRRKALGLCSWCRACHSAYSAEKRAEAPVEFWAREALRGARSRALKSGVPFLLTAAFLASVAPTHCPALGTPLRYVGGDGHAVSDSATVDRLVPSRGYVPGNVTVISSRANRMKNDGTLEEHEKLIVWLRTQH